MGFWRSRLLGNIISVTHRCIVPWNNSQPQAAAHHTLRHRTIYNLQPWRLLDCPKLRKLLLETTGALGPSLIRSLKDFTCSWAGKKRYPVNVSTGLARTHTASCVCNWLFEKNACTHTSTLVYTAMCVCEPFASVSVGYLMPTPFQGLSVLPVSVFILESPLLNESVIASKSFREDTHSYVKYIFLFTANNDDYGCVCVCVCVIHEVQCVKTISQRTVCTCFYVI